MPRLRNVLSALGVGVLALIAVVAARTATWRPPDLAGDPPALAAPILIDHARAAARLAEAIRFQTVSHADPADNQWQEWDRLHAWLRSTYPRLHAVATREVVAGHTLIYAWPGADPQRAPIVLMAHQDVVPVAAGSEGDWKAPPFAGAVLGGVVHGRGALDDKGSLVALMEAAEALAERGFRPTRGVYLVLGHDEEVGGTGAAAAAAWFAARQLRPEFVLDEGGLALTANPVTGRPIAVINVAEKGYATLEVTARDAGGHASMPPARTAVHTLAQAIDRIAGDPLPIEFDGPGAAMIEVLAGDAPLSMRMAVANAWLFGPVLKGKLAASPAGAAMFRSTLAPTMLAASPQDNVLAPRATALFNVRLHPRDSLEGVLARARAAVSDLAVELEWRGRAEAASPVSSTERAAWRLLAALAGESTGAPVAPGISTGATDGRHFTAVADDVYRFLPIRVDSDTLASMHGADERLPVEELGRAAEFYARLIASAAG